MRKDTKELPRVIKLFQPVLKHLFLLVLLHERIPLPEAVELVDHALEELQQGFFSNGPKSCMQHFLQSLVQA